MSMPSIHATLLLFLVAVVAYSVVTTATSLLPSPSRTPVFDFDDVNITFINELPSDVGNNRTELFLLYNTQQTKTRLEPLVPVLRLANEIFIQSSNICWITRCINFNHYDPYVDVDLLSLHYSGRLDGLFKSKDNTNWDQVATWG
ncbi:hypothetical protein HN51_056462 [Arachis hypogaea]